jgi:mono/diheme cytochrome c family protein
MGTLAVVVMVLAAITMRETARAQGAQDSRDGRELYVTYGCWQCHGYEGQGSVAGPRLAPRVLPYIAFERLVRRPANVMPAYAPSALSDADLEAIFAYLSSITEPPALEQIPALQ